jgi:hypothetical protein
MTTRFAPPSRCALALSRERKAPVQSTTTSAPRSPQGISAGFFVEEKGMVLSSTIRFLPSSEIFRGDQPWTESYFRR